MINIKVKKLCEKYQSFIQIARAKAYVKPTLEMYVLQSLQEKFSGFHFFNPGFKNSKIR